MLSDFITISPPNQDQAIYIDLNEFRMRLKMELKVFGRSRVAAMLEDRTDRMGVGQADQEYVPEASKGDDDELTLFQEA